MMIDTYNGQNIDAYDGEKVDLIAVALGREFKDREKDRTRPIVLDFQPGNGSRYVLVFTPLTEGQARAVGNNWVLSLPEHGRCYPINVPGYQTPEYLMKHWLSGIGDAVPVSHLLNSAWRLNDPMAEARGATDEQLAAAGHTDDTPCPGCSTVVEGFLDSVEGSSAEA